jgi:hypothetical protein
MQSTRICNPKRIKDLAGKTLLIHQKCESLSTQTCKARKGDDPPNLPALVLPPLYVKLAKPTDEKINKKH